MRIKHRRFMHTLVLGLALALVTPTFVSCYGRFPLTRAVYRFNGDISSNGIIQSVVMWAFVIIPVYWVASLGDVLIFNLVEFWTGDTLHVSSTSEKDGVRSTLTPMKNGREAILTVSREGKVIRQERFVRVTEGKTEVRDMKGKLDGVVIRTGKGDLQLMDAKGIVIRTLPSNALAGI